MKKYISVVLIVLFLNGCATWSTQDKLLGLTSCIATAADAYTTTQFLNNPNNYEWNPIMGKHPSDSEVWMYMATSQIIALTIAHFFPEWRTFILGGKTVVNTGLAINNTTLDWEE